MKKRLFLLFCTALLLLSTAVQAQETSALAPVPPAAETSAARAPSLAAEKEALPSPFVRTRSYENNFSDVGGKAWYRASVAALYEYGLTEGAGGKIYAPDESVTLAELATFSARVRARYAGETIPAAQAGEAWYQPYVTYLQSAGLLDTAFDGYYTETATRAQMAGIFAAALPEEWFDARNAAAVTEGYALHRYITDVNDYTPYQPQILWLYKQGIVGGVDGTGSFRPDDALKRSEVAALVVRMIDPDARLTLAWQTISYRSAAGTKWADLVSEPAEVTSAPASGDAAAIDALLRQMLRANVSTISLQYDDGLSADETAKLTRAFTTGIKRYCEQMYNSAVCRAYASGKATLTFSSTACTPAQLMNYRAQTMARAIAVHDALWESGYLSDRMSEYELARAYFVWLCNNCTYDEGTVGSRSLSHLAYSALVDGVAVCDGYTGAYNLLLRLEGIECTSLFNSDHIWTVAVLDGKTYHIDTTWGDQGARADLSFFGMTEAQSRAKHAW